FDVAYILSGGTIADFGCTTLTLRATVTTTNANCTPNLDGGYDGMVGYTCSDTYSSADCDNI
ncbi:MAG: hypothetical protein Q7T11_06575, partial [Deltaproteobacteria bacterium]|nr:hypothetical protein [Deltaproteobacteria bacterium]